MRKRLLSWLLVLTMITSLIPSTLVTSAFAADVSGITQELKFGAADSEKTLGSDGGYILKGTLDGKVIKITNNAKVTLYLQDVTMTAATSPIQVESGATLTLVVADVSDNTITCTATAVDDTNKGLTAGISVPDGATLTIDAPDGGANSGKLTVTGGYGGAGIGGGAGYGYDGTQAGSNGKAGDAGADGYTVGPQYGWYRDSYSKKGGDGGAGGVGGKYGNSGTDCGTVQIKNGIITAEGGNGGAGIGGGRGYDGERGGDAPVVGEVNGPKEATYKDRCNGHSASEIYNQQLWLTGGMVTSSNPGCGGAGGNGGNGGDGGDGGQVTIDGGAVTAQAGADAMDIGGGAAGNGGAAGTGANGAPAPSPSCWANRNHTSKCTWLNGGRGSDGYRGLRGAGGNGGTLTINAGQVAVAKIGKGADGETADNLNPAVAATETGTLWIQDRDGNYPTLFTYWDANPTVDRAYQDATVHKGGEAEKPQASPAPTEITVILPTTNQHQLSSLLTYTVGTTGPRPQNTKGEELYRVKLEAVNQKDISAKADDAIFDFKINGVRYSAAADAQGIITLWLPKTTLELSGDIVTSAKYGTIRKADQDRLTVSEDMEQANQVKLFLAETVSVTVTGTTDNSVTELYRYTGDVAMGKPTAAQTALTQKGYKLTGVKVTIAGVQATENTNYTWDLASGTVEVNIEDLEVGTQIDIEFLYEGNMTNVTIKALYKGTNKPVESFTEYTVPMEIGTKVTYTAPVIDNHINDGSTLADDGTYTVVENGTITFYYYKQTGNVTYKAVMDDTNEVLWQGDGTVEKGNAPATDVLPTDAAFKAKYERKPGDVAKITDSDDKEVTTYNGIGSLTVTYTYQHKTRNVVARLYDITKRDTVLETAAAVKCNVGEYATINAPTLPTGYSYFGDSSKIVKVEEGADAQDAQYVDFYCEASDNAVITVRLYDSAANRDADTDGSKAFQTLTFPAAFGVATEVKAPTMIGWELDTAASDNDATKSVTPVKGGTAPVVKFVYKPVYDTITVKLTNEDGSADLPTDALPTGWTGRFQVQKGQNFSIAAPSIVNYKLANGETLEKSLSAEQIKKNNKTITFKYIKKETGSVTVKHILKGTDKVITSYTASGSVGEWFTATKLTTDTNGITADGRYTFTESDSNKATQTVKVTAAEQTITFEYEPNYVTVNTYTSVDGAETEYQTGIEVVKTTGTQKLYAPSKTGYVLKGITVKKNVVMNEDGSTTTFPDYWNNNELTLTNLTSDVKVVYYYEKINDNIKDYQAAITVKDQYETYELGGRTETVIKDVNAEIASKAYDGYVLIAYQIGDSADQKQTVEADKANNFKLTHKFDEDTTVTFFYGRADGSAVVPGEDTKFGTDDDVIIKPKDDNKPSVNPDGSVKVPNGAEVVTPNGTVIPPNGSIVKPDGTIVAPDGNDKTDPGIPIDPSNPGNAAPTYLYVKYMANGGKGEIPTQFFKKGDTVTIAANNFTADNKTADGWNTQEDGNGVDYAAGAKQLNESLTLFAKWTTNDYAESVTITFHANLTGVQDEQQTIGFFDGTSATENLRANTFVLNGWTFGGWSKKQVGSIDFANKAAFTFKHGDDTTLSLYAQWYKQDGSSITVPGKDGDPSNADTNVTGAGNGIDRDPTTGVITIPAGGTIISGNEEITLPNGGKLNPDGSYSINLPNGGTIDVGKDGKEEVKGDDGTTKPNADVVTLTYEINNGENDVVVIKAVKNEEATAIANPFTYAGHVFLNWMANINGTVEEIVAGTGTFTPQDDVTLYAQWAKQNAGNGSVELPGKDGILEEPHDKDNVIVTPDNGGSLEGPKQPSGGFEVKDEDATVTRPDPTDPDSKEEIKVPEGTVIQPDGTIELPNGGGTIRPDDKFPDGAALTDYVVVTYDPNGGTGNIIRQLLKKDEAAHLLGDDVFTAPHGSVFVNWLDEDNGTSFAANEEIHPTTNVTLKAQWKNGNPAPSYTAEIVFDSNTDEGIATQTVTSVDSETITRQLDPYADHFTAPADWSFMGWSTTKAASQSSTFYEDEAKVTLNNDDTLNLYAVVYKIDADTKVVTLPGADGEPNTGDDVTVTPPADGTELTPGKGFIEAPAGSEITQPSGTIKVVEGTVTVYPDGSIVVPDGSKVTDKDGNEVTGPTTIDKDGKTDIDNTKPIQKPDGSIVVPGKDGVTGTPDDITVKPAGPNEPAGRTDDDGNVIITNPDGAEVTIPGNDPEEVKVPNGTVIAPNGDMTLVYTIKYVDASGNALQTAATVKIKVGATETVTAATISGYNVSGDASKTVTGAVSTDPNNYIITFTYTKKSSGSGSSGGGSSSGGNHGGNNSGNNNGNNNGSNNGNNNGNGNNTSKPNDPTQTGVSDWLRTDEHTASMSGYGNGKFGPDDSVTRAQIAQIFYRLLKDQNIKITVNFTDVAEDAWYAKAVNTLGSLGIVSGTGNGKFDPNRAISRAEFCAIATRFAKVASTVENPFSDIKESDWYYKAVTTAASYGWVTGMNDGKFHPSEVISRAQAATIINRMLGAAADRSYVDSYVTNPYTDVSKTHWAFYQIMEATIAHSHSYDKEGVEIWNSLK